MLEDSGVFISAAEVKSFKTSTPASLSGSVDTISEGDPDAMIGTGSITNLSTSLQEVRDIKVVIRLLRRINRLHRMTLLL
ncbi:hypothetical protein JCM18916_1949 [Cutibacterium acnes JCM 18916]|nr:hypothetical protein JCM18916_1949 [Cutibacterium acnes JCM 18916]